jgi:cytochrome bd ubiquinol oxidase subunit II
LRDAVDAGHPELATAFRGRAIGSAILAGALAISGFAVIHHNAPRLFDHLTHDWGLALVLASTGLGLFTFWLLARRSFHLARYTAAGAVAALIAAWAAAQYPYMLPGQLTIKQAAAGHTTLQAALIAAGLAVLILGPALGWLFKLVLSGQLYTAYEPLDQHFNPIHAGQNPGPADATWPQP